MEQENQLHRGHNMKINSPNSASLFLAVCVSSSAYTLNRVGCSNRGSYRVLVSDVCGSAAEATATLHKAGCP